MNTYFIEASDVKAGEIIVSGELHHHLTKVLRLKVGDKLHFSDNQSHTYDGEAVEITKDRLRVKLSRVQAITGEPPLDVYLLQCLPRGDKMEQIIQKTTELGVSCIVAVASDNSQVRWKHKATDKAARYAKIAAAAAEQCGRGLIPRLEVAESLEASLAYLPPEAAIIFCYEKEGKHSLKSELLKVNSKTIAIVIGPEGGFSTAEAQAVMARGGKAVTMGPRILRTETAGVCALAAIMYEKGDWGCIVEN